MGTLLPTTSIQAIQYEGETVKMSNDIHNVLIDTGATISFLRKSVIPTDFKLERTRLSLSNAFGSNMCQISEKLECNITVDGIIVPETCFYIIPQGNKFSYNAVLGIDILRRFKLNLNNSPGTPLLFNKFELSETEADYVEIIERTKESVLFSQENKAISAFDVSFVKIRKSKDIKVRECVSIIGTKEMEDKNVFLQTNFSNKNHFHVRIENRNDYPVFIKKGAALAEEVTHMSQHLLNFLIDRKDLPVREQRTHEAEFEKWKKKRDLLTKDIDMSSDIDAAIQNAPIQYAQGLKNILVKYSWNFSRTPSDAGLSRDYVCEIRLEDTKPVFHKPYPIDAHKIEKVDAKLKEMLNGDILQSTISGFNSPVIFVLKKNKKLRVVNNYSAGGEKSINSKLVMPRFPTLPIRALLAKLSTAIANLKTRYPRDKLVFCGLDLANAFYTLSIREKHRDYTTFIFGDKQLQYQRMCQGLASSPSTFQSFASKILDGVEGQNDSFFCFNYQDDFLVITTERHCNETIDKIFNRIEKFHVIVSLAKCEFYKESVKFLGFLIDQNGIKASESKVDTLTQLKPPETAKEAMSFVGCLNYYCRLIPKLSALLSPIT